MKHGELPGTGGPEQPVTVTIDGKDYLADKGEFLLSVAIREGITIPHLCFEESLDPYGACRLCLVEAGTGGRHEMTTACTLRVTDGLDVVTDTPMVAKHRKILLELYLAEAPGSEDIKALAARYGVTKTRFLRKIIRDDPLGGRCVLCGLCVRVCNEVMGAGAINFINRGPYTLVSTPYLEATADCSGCGACVRVCPTHAIRMEDTGSERVMLSWNDTRVPLAECTGCGRFFAPKALSAKTLARISPQLDETLAGLCPECRGQWIAKQQFLARSDNAGDHV